MDNRYPELVKQNIAVERPNKLRYYYNKKQEKIRQQRKQLRK